MTRDEALARLREPFTPEQMGKKPQITCGACSKSQTKNCDKHPKSVCPLCKSYITTSHMHLDFVGHAHVRERFLEVDPEWTWEAMGHTTQGIPYLDENGGLWIRLTIVGVTRIGYGDAPGKSGGNAVKEAMGDAFRNAAQSFGVALDLWKKEAPAPTTEQTTERPKPPPQLTPERRAVELRKLIAAIGGKAGKSLDQIGADFHEWSRGSDITSAGVAVLAEYKAHIGRGA